MFSKALRIGFACSLAVVTPAAVVAAQITTPPDTVVLSLSEARARATRANPDLLVAAQWPRIAQGDVRSAGLLRFNPEVAFESRSPGSGYASRYEASLGLELEVAGQRGLRSRAADASYAASEGRFENEARRVLTAVGRAYAALAAAEQRVRLAEQISTLNADLYQAVRTQLTEGEVSVLEANLAAIEAARARSRTLEATSERVTAALELKRLLGLDPSTPVSTAGPLSADSPSAAEGSVEARVQLALSTRPDLDALERDLEGARQRVRLLRREAWPNLRLAGLATREDPVADPRFGLSLGMALPLFNRNQGLIDRSRAELAEVEQMRGAAESRVRIEVEDAVRRYVSAEEEVDILEVELLGPIRENQGLLEIAYREGMIDLATALLLRNQLLDAELSYWDAWERREWARTDLQSATGEILEGITLQIGSER